MPDYPSRPLRAVSACPAGGCHRICGGYRCTCTCHGPDHDPDPPPPTWEQAVRSIFGDCIGHEHRQEGHCVYCVPCGRRLYQGSVIPAGEMAELRAELAKETPDAH